MGSIMSADTGASSTPQLFVDACRFMMPKLMDDFGFSELDAAAIMGNAGHESNGGRSMQEKAPKAGRGGRGLFQWTGPRRVEYEKWLARKGASGDTDWPVVYGFLFRELTGPEKSAVAKTKAAGSLLEKTEAFERAFERADPATVNYASRYLWAQRALAAYRSRPQPQPPAPPAPTLAEAHRRIAALEDRLTRVEEALAMQAVVPVKPEQVATETPP